MGKGFKIMTLSSVDLVPELQYWFNHFVINSSVNKNKVPAPAAIGSTYMGTASFIELLFNNDYSESSYKYLYYEVTTRNTWPSVVRNRILIYPAAAQYFQITANDSTGENIFNLQDDDLTMMDALLQYRIDSTSVTVIDSTSNTFISTVLSANYSSLSTNLSRLIFLFLDFQINGNTSNFNNQMLVSSSISILESMYETYVLDEFFNIVSARGT